ncbi:unnamed protein product [Withania somnifera]
MGRSTSLLVLFLPFIFLLSVETLGAAVVTPIIKSACDYSNVQSFCYYVLGNDPSGPYAKTKFNLEDIAVQAAYSNYSNIHRKVWTITANETNPEFKQIYRKCLHEYNLMKSKFEKLILTLGFQGNLDLAANDVAYLVYNCMLYFNNPNIPNPIAQDNNDLLSFVDLIRSIFYAPLG